MHIYVCVCIDTYNLYITEYVYSSDLHASMYTWWLLKKGRHLNNILSTCTVLKEFASDQRNLFSLTVRSRDQVKYHTGAWYTPRRYAS